MQNQSSPAQLLFPTIPANYCPEGKWSDILNSFIQLYLNNGTVNIPFLNQVTPQEIQSLQQSILTLQNQLNTVNYQSGVITVTPASVAGTPVVSFVRATFSTPYPTASYNISGYFTVPASSFTDLYPVSWGIVTNSITTAGFSIWVSNSNTQITSFTWQASNLGSL